MYVSHLLMVLDPCAKEDSTTKGHGQTLIEIKVSRKLVIERGQGP